MLQLDKTVVRLHFKYYIQFWLPRYRKGVEALETVQKRFTRLLPILGDMSCKERMNKLRVLFSAVSEAEGRPGRNL